MAGTESAIQTSFTDLIKALKFQNECFSIDLPKDWLQGRTAYGGLSAALCLEVTLRTFPDLPPLRSANFTFTGPALGVLHIRAEILRQGKSMVFAVAEIEGEMGVAARAIFCFGLSRDTGSDHVNIPMPKVSTPDGYPSFFTFENRPNFMSHFEGRFAGGGMPCSAGDNPEMLVWLRHRDIEHKQYVVGLLALSDALPPAFFALIPKPVPISTVTWSVDFLDDKPETEDGWWFIKSASESLQNGFSSQKILIWTSGGQPVLTAQQNIAVFEGK